MKRLTRMKILNYRGKNLKSVKKTGLIESGNLKFNNHIGDITKGIKWTWAINENSIDLFEKCVDSLKPMINKHFNNKFNIFGASFITLNKKEVKDSEFHLDVNSFDDMEEETNILTLIFPLYIEDDMGGLEYMDNREKRYTSIILMMFLFGTRVN